MLTRRSKVLGAGFALFLATSFNALAIPPAAGGDPAIVNGNFDTDDSGWETSVHSGWVSDLGCDGLPGSCFVNSVINDIGWIQQNITKLTPGKVYRISGCYKTRSEWFGGPSFQAKIDGEVMFQGGFTRIDDWTPFEFTFCAADTDAMLRFESQVGGTDSDYVVDEIVLTSAIVNGGFDTDCSGWETSVHSGPWVLDSGCDGLPGACFVNSVINDIGWIQQSISGLTPSEVYWISGCYKTGFNWYDGPSFQAMIDGEVMFEGGFTRIDDWTPFEFTFVAADTDAVLRFESQVGGTDSDYVVDEIVLTCVSTVPPIPTVSEWGIVAMTLLLLAAGTLVVGRRRSVLV